MNGFEGYGSVTVIDGDANTRSEVDKYRIHIWEIDSGAIIYDIQMGDNDYADPAAELSGGIIVIHMAK